MTVYNNTLNQLVNIALSRFEWKNVPNTIDTRYLELMLLTNGSCLVFKDDVVGLLALPFTGSSMDVYNNPTNRRAYAVTGYNAVRDNTDSVIIWDNMSRKNTHDYLEYTAKRVANIERTIDNNVSTQKTPYIITCENEERLSFLNLYKEIDGNAPVIKGTSKLNPDKISVFHTSAPYVSDKLVELKKTIIADCLSGLGVPILTETKKERMLVSEIDTMNEKAISSRWSYLSERQTAAAKINNMFGTNIEVNYR